MYANKNNYKCTFYFDGLLIKQDLPTTIVMVTFVFFGKLFITAEYFGCHGGLLSLFSHTNKSIALFLFSFSSFSFSPYTVKLFQYV